MEPDLTFLQVPAFSRISDYWGLWAITETAFAAMWRTAELMDLRQHVQEAKVGHVWHFHKADGTETKVEAKIELAVGPEMIPGPNNKSIAMVKLQGLLMKSASSMGGTSTIQARRDIRQAANDPNVAGILLAIDSPGGTVSGTDDLATDIRAAGKSKPVWAHVDDLGASAAYWAASQASRISANSPTALVGSIGTLQVIHDYSEAAAKAGITTHVFGTGSLKGLGTQGAKLTDEHQAHIKGLVNAVQQSFDAAVKRGRNMSDQQLMEVRHGGVLTATAALKAKLIDAVQPLQKTIQEFTQALQGPRGFSATGGLPMLKQTLPMLGNKGEEI